jgi:hypothetical protein
MPGPSGELINHGPTREEKIEIADYVIAQWIAFREKLIAAAG